MGKIPRLKPDAPVEVLWVDIIQDSRWQDHEEAAEAMPALCKSVGYYLNHTSKILRISGSLNRNMGQRDVQVFPRGVVLKVNRLKKGNK